MKLNINSKMLVLLQGLPGSGKSTFIRKHHLEEYTISKDEFRIKAGCVSDGEIKQDSNGVVKRIVYMLLEERLKHGKFTVIDETNVHNSTVEKYKEYASKYGYEVIILRFHVPIDELIERNKHRGFRNVSTEQIMRLNGLLAKMHHTSIDANAVDGVTYL